MRASVGASRHAILNIADYSRTRNKRSAGRHSTLLDLATAMDVLIVATTGEETPPFVRSRNLDGSRHERNLDQCRAAVSSKSAVSVETRDAMARLVTKISAPGSTKGVPTSVVERPWPETARQDGARAAAYT
jgi:hypothetical protein